MSIHASKESAQAEWEALRRAGWPNCRLNYTAVLGWHVLCPLGEQPQEAAQAAPATPAVSAPADGAE